MRTSKKLSRWAEQSFAMFICLALCTPGLINIFQAFDIAERQPDWLITQANVIQSYDTHIFDNEHCHFRYAYVVNNQRFTNWRYSTTSDQCRGTHKFRKSDVIFIYYDPENPANSVVERVSPSLWFVIGNGLLSIPIIGLALVMIVYWIVKLFSFLARRATRRTPSNSGPTPQKIYVERNSVQSKGMHTGDISVTLPINFQDSIFGTTKTIIFDRRVMYSQGTTALMPQKSVDIVIPAGVKQGTKLRVSGLGDVVSHGPDRDLYVHLEMPYTYKNLTREAGNLLSVLQLTAAQGTQGGQFLITVVDGDAVALAVPPGTAHNERLTIKGKGVPTLGNPTVRGDHIVEIHIVTE